jgi:electron transfer flavoprotein alpha subunit
MKAIIDPAKCTVCGVCEEVCPFEAIKVHETWVEITDECTLCGMCVDSCEFGAISLPEAGAGPEEDLSSYSGVWVYAEWRSGGVHRVAHELLGAGRQLADKRGTRLTAVVMGHNLKGAEKELIEHGADAVYLIDYPELAVFSDETYAKVLVELARHHKPEILLAGATTIGRSFIPRVAATLGTGLTADCTELDIGEDGLLLQTRPAFGGNVMATIICPNRRPQMATVRPKVMRPSSQPGREGTAEKVEVSPECLTNRIEVMEVLEQKDQTAKLSEADVIVTGGRGLQKAENFSMVEEVAGLLGGAVGASRSVVDDGWIAPSHQVGQTGQTVAPKLYMAVGVSGAIQHVVGMQGSDIVVAVNKDPEAPIFDVAGYAVVGDLFEFLPAFTKKLRREQGEG